MHSRGQPNGEHSHSIVIEVARGRVVAKLRPWFNFFTDSGNSSDSDDNESPSDTTGVLAIVMAEL